MSTSWKPPYTEGFSKENMRRKLYSVSCDSDAWCSHITTSSEPSLTKEWWHSPVHRQTYTHFLYGIKTEALRTGVQHITWPRNMAVNEGKLYATTKNIHCNVYIVTWATTYNFCATSQLQFQHMTIYKGVSKSFWTGHLEWELQMVWLSATRCSCITILWVSPVSFATTTLCIASQWVVVVVVVVIIYFIINSVRKLSDTPSYVATFNQEFMVS
jgi:hypothetical protein